MMAMSMALASTSGSLAGSAATISSRRSPVPLTVRRRDGPRGVQTQRPELVGLALRARGVHLVDGEEHRLAGALEDPSDLLVVGDETGLAVDEEHDDVSLFGGHHRLGPDRGLELVDVAGLDAAGIDEQEVHAVPVRTMVAAITGHSTRLVHDGVGGLGDPVDERRLADVRAPDYGDYGQRHERVTPSRRRKIGPLPRSRPAVLRRPRIPDAGRRDCAAIRSAVLSPSSVIPSALRTTSGTR